MVVKDDFQFYLETSKWMGLKKVPAPLKSRILLLFIQIKRSICGLGSRYVLLPFDLHLGNQSYCIEIVLGDMLIILLWEPVHSGKSPSIEPKLKVRI